MKKIHTFNGGGVITLEECLDFVLLEKASHEIRLRSGVAVNDGKYNWREHVRLLARKPKGQLW